MARTLLSLVKSAFSRSRADATSPNSRQRSDSSTDGRLFRLGSDEDYEAHRDVLGGLQFSATLSLDTPLRVLEHHGEIHKGSPSTAPEYGDASEGIWVPVVDWASIGMSSPGEGTMASVIGEVPANGGAFLPFLREFRAIVESGDAVGAQLRRIEKFSSTTPEFHRIRMRLGAHFAREWFAEKLTAIPGIGSKTAQALFAAGLHDFPALRAASDESLLKVPGIGPAAVAKIRAFIESVAV